MRLERAEREGAEVREVAREKWEAGREEGSSTDGSTEDRESGGGWVMAGASEGR